MSDERAYTLAAAACLLTLLPIATTLADEAIGEEGERCLRSRSISRTEVIDDYTILFYLRGKAIYRNTLPRRCARLARDRRFMYRTTVSRVCKSDHITVLTDSGFGSGTGPTCRLGRFHLISEEEAEALRGEQEIEPEPIPPAEPEEPEISPGGENTGE